MEIASDSRVAAERSGMLMEAGVRGLSGFGLAMIFFGLHQVEVASPASKLLAAGLIFCALWQIAVGFTVWKKGNFWGATFMIPSGLFLVSLLSLVILPEHGWGRGPDSPALASYFIIWGIFNVAIFTGLSQNGFVLRLVIGLLSVFCFLMALGSILSGTLIADLAIFDAIVCGLLAAAIGPVRFLNIAAEERRKLHEGQD